MNPDVADILAVVQAAPLLTVIDRFCVRRHGILGFFIGGEVEVIVYLATEALSYFFCATEFSKFNSTHIGADPKKTSTSLASKGKSCRARSQRRARTVHRRTFSNGARTQELELSGRSLVAGVTFQLHGRDVGHSFQVSVTACTTTVYLKFVFVASHLHCISLGTLAKV